MRKSGNISEEERLLTVLRKLAELGPMSILEMGFNASPLLVRNMAARGLASVSVTISPRGQEMLDKLRLKAQRRAMKALKAARAITQEEAA